VLHDTAVPPTEDTVASASNVGADLSTEWVTVIARHRPASRPTPMPAVRVKGSRENVSLMSVARKQILLALVGRLHSDTTEEELTKYLMDEGIKGVVAKNGRKFNSAAFHVTCCTESRDKFYDENCWPSGVELRDWVYYSRCNGQLSE